MAPGDTMEDALFNNQFKKDMHQLQNAFLDKLDDVLRELKMLRPEFNTGITKIRKIEAIYHDIHNLAGSGIIFGFPEVSSAARELYAMLRPLFDLEQHSDAQIEMQKATVAYIDNFITACSDILERREESVERMILPPAGGPGLTPDSKDIFIIARTFEQSEEMVTHLNRFGYHPVLVEDQGRLQTAIRGAQLKAILIFSDLDEGDLEIIRSILKTEEEAHVDIPVIVLSEKDDFTTRLAAARIGARGFFSGTPDILKVIERIENLSARTHTAPQFHVLIVDDDEMLSEFYRNTLKRTGLTVTVVASAPAALDQLEEHDIDLVLIDSTMPLCSGLELSTVIHQFDRYRNIPIMIMSSQEDAEAAVARHAELGMDDFIIKPFSPEYLMSVIRTRAIRLSETKAFISHDHFTGLLNHEQFNEALGREVMRVRRHHARSCYVTLDLDHFRDINAEHGHAAGDKLIKVLARMLQQHLRRSDVIGRCGGQRFGVIMPGCDLENAERIIENLRARFTDQFYNVGSGKARVTFSGGITQIKGTATLEDLINKTDAALREAKKTGRNRVIPAAG
ncbi:MAG: diguanylate cyclase [Alphaproteobacteria bacterium]|nr:diguanylate cyclase [Alphaproteobacteria bacterium]